MKGSALHEQECRFRLIGVTGGIGSGKSVVCRICSLRGLPVYDCDTRASALMNSSPALRESLVQIAGERIYCCGTLNRKLLASVLFSDEKLRARVNAVVHEAVREDLRRWIRNLRSGVAIVESAILLSSGLAEMVGAIWLVDAPMALRVSRVMSRSGLGEDAVRERMQAQSGEFDALPPEKTSLICNDGLTPLIPQIDTLLKKYYNA